MLHVFDKVVGYVALASFVVGLARFRPIWAYRHNRIAYVVSQAFCLLTGIGYLLHSSLIQNGALVIVLIWLADVWCGGLWPRNRRAEPSGPRSGTEN